MRQCQLGGRLKRQGHGGVESEEGTHISGCACRGRVRFEIAYKERKHHAFDSQRSAETVSAPDSEPA